LALTIKTYGTIVQKIRTAIIDNLQKNNFNKTELNVASINYGQKQDISPEIIQDYHQYAGAIHILSVSGLHIGLFYSLLAFLLKPIPNTRKGSLS
jgi:competence protein ComEC